METTKRNLVKKLKSDVNNHFVLQNKWLIEKSQNITKEDLTKWLCQEYFVSVEFVNWFLLAAASSPSQYSKLVLVKNVWEELGEGKLENSHVKILETFLYKLGVNLQNNKPNRLTTSYLETMKSIIIQDYYEALGALGPANEYLLRKEYGMVYEAYKTLQKKGEFPTAKFFEINLEADNVHSQVLFDLIEDVCDSEEKENKVISGNQKALDARLLFYEGLITNF